MRQATRPALFRFGAGAGAAAAWRLITSLGFISRSKPAHDEGRPPGRQRESPTGAENVYQPCHFRGACRTNVRLRPMKSREAGVKIC